MRRIRDGGNNLAPTQIGHLVENLVKTQTRSEQIKNIGHSNPHPADTGPSAALAGLHLEQGNSRSRSLRIVVLPNARNFDLLTKAGVAVAVGEEAFLEGVEAAWDCGPGGISGRSVFVEEISYRPFSKSAAQVEPPESRGDSLGSAMGQGMARVGSFHARIFSVSGFQGEETR